MSEKRGRGRPKNPFTEQNIGTVQAVERALQILSTLASSDRMSLTELSLSVGVPAATTHRLLNTLQKHEFVVFDTERQDWLIGVEAFRVGASFLKRRDLLQISKPIMQRLMEDTGETANLAIRNGANVIFIGQVETTHPIRAFFPPSTETSMHASGTGKAILAALQQDQVEKLRETLSQVKKAFLRELRNEDEALDGSPAPSEVFVLNPLIEASSQDML